MCEFILNFLLSADKYGFDIFTDSQALLRPIGIHKKKINKSTDVLTRNLIHRNREWNLTIDHKIFYTCQKLLDKEGTIAKSRV